MKRFIAGAKCPSCEQEDTLYFNSEDQYDIVHCSRCNYQEKRAEKITPSEEKAEKNSPIKWH